MPLFQFSALHIPSGYVNGVPNKINETDDAVGFVNDSTGVFKAILWQSGASILLNWGGTTSEAYSLNSKTNIVGIVDNQPLFWDNSVGLANILKRLDGQPAAAGFALGINNFDQISGRLGSYFYGPPVLWQTANSIPINLLAGVNIRKISLNSGSAPDINNNGAIVGGVWDALYPNSYGFIWDAVNNLNLFLDPNPGEFYGASAINDLNMPQILGSHWPHGPFLYDTQSGLLQDLNLAGQPGGANDINNNGDVVGSFYSSGLNYDSDAALWSFNGLVRTNLNHPTISDAHIRGWHLLDAKSINDKGHIVGTGYKNGDKTKTLPWLLKPSIPIRKIPLEYMLPHLLWPGQGYDSPRPKGWPFKLPFPIPPPNPFQIVGRGANALNNVLVSQGVKELVATLQDEKSRNEIKAIASIVFKREMKKLKTILANPSVIGKRNLRKN